MNKMSVGAKRTEMLLRRSVWTKLNTPVPSKSAGVPCSARGWVQTGRSAPALTKHVHEIIRCMQERSGVDAIISDWDVGKGLSSGRKGRKAAVSDRMQRRNQIAERVPWQFRSTVPWVQLHGLVRTSMVRTESETADGGRLRKTVAVNPSRRTLGTRDNVPASRKQDDRGALQGVEQPRPSQL